MSALGQPGYKNEPSLRVPPNSISEISLSFISCLSSSSDSNVDFQQKK